MNHRRFQEVPRCPQCRSGWLETRAKKEAYFCKGCGHSFPFCEARVKKEKAGGSGVIAGKIIHGKGGVWGSGLA